MAAKRLDVSRWLGWAVLGPLGVDVGDRTRVGVFAPPWMHRALDIEPTVTQCRTYDRVRTNGIERTMQRNNTGDIPQHNDDTDLDNEITAICAELIEQHSPPAHARSGGEHIVVPIGAEVVGCAAKAAVAVFAPRFYGIGTLTFARSSSGWLRTGGGVPQIFDGNER